MDPDLALPSGDSAVIDRLRVNFYTDGSSDLARDRLERIARDELAAACGESIEQVLAALGQAGAEAVIRIRSLRVDLLLAVDDRPDAGQDAPLAAQWASAVAVGVARTLTQGSAQNVVHFDDPAAYLAAYLAEACAGRAGGLWYFSEFEPLSGLPPGAAAAHLLAGRPDLAGQVLVGLRGTGRLDALLAGLSLTDAHGLWQALGFDASAMPDLAAVEPSLLRVIGEEAGAVRLVPNQEPLDRARNALRLYTTLVSGHPELAGLSGMAEAIRSVLLLAAVLPSLPPSWAGLLAEDAGLDGWTSAAAALRRLPEGLAGAGAWLAAALASGSGLRQRVGAVAGVAVRLDPHAGHQHAARAGESPNGPSALVTPAAGLFLLLPPIVRLRLAPVLAAYPAAAANPEQVNLLIYLLLAAAAGPDARAAGLLDDPALAAAAGLPGRPPAPALAALAPRSAGDLALWSGSLALLRPPGLSSPAGSAQAHDVVAGLTRGGEGWRVALRDLATGRWLAAYTAAAPVVDLARLSSAGVRVRSLVLPGLSPADATAGASSEAPTSAAAGSPADAVAGASAVRPAPSSASAPAASPSAAAAPASAAAAVASVAGSEPGVAVYRPGEAPPELQARIERVQRLLPIEMAHVWLAADLSLDPETAMAAGQLAVLAAREFAAGLRGFEAGSLPYLARNIFSSPGTVTLEPERLLIHAASSPLQIVLAMAGLAGDTAPASWLAGRRVTVEL